MFFKYKPIILSGKHYIEVLNNLNEALIEDGLIKGADFYFFRNGKDHLIVKSGEEVTNKLSLEVLKESGGHLGHWNVYKDDDFSDADKGLFQVLVDLLAEGVFFEEWEFDYSFTQNRGCGYFPCHEIANEREFNCLFCYCPLYFIDDCGGAFSVLDNNIKDCSDCTIPHERNNYDFIIDKLRDNM